MIIGLTGNSGSGKSSVAGILANEYGAYIIDADEIAHEVLTYEPAYTEVVEEFGESVLGSDRAIDRKRLGRVVFTDSNRRKRLIEITHKYIVAEMLARLERARGFPHVLMDAPLLVEAGLHRAVDVVWLVYAAPEVRLARIIERDGLTMAEASARIENQTAFDELKKYADVVLDNSGGYEELKTKVRRAMWEGSHGDFFNEKRYPENTTKGENLC